MILLHKMTDISDQIRFFGYYEATCEMALKDDGVLLHECIVQRPTGRTIAGDRITDCLALVVETELTEAQIASATIGIAQYGREISEREAMVKAGRAW